MQDNCIVANQQGQAQYGAVWCSMVQYVAVLLTNRARPVSTVALPSRPAVTCTHGRTDAPRCWDSWV